MVTLPSQSFQQGCSRVLRNLQTGMSMISAGRQASLSQQTCRPVSTHAPLPCTSRTGRGCLGVCATPIVNCWSTRYRKSSGSSWVLLGCPMPYKMPRTGWCVCLSRMPRRFLQTPRSWRSTTCPSAHCSSWENQEPANPRCCCTLPRRWYNGQSRKKHIPCRSYCASHHGLNNDQHWKTG